VTKAITTIRLGTKLSDETVKIPKVESRTAAVHLVPKEIAALRRFKQLMKKNAGKLRFESYGE
jgi:hypothetical protein